MTLDHEAELDLHQRLLDGDPAAPDECARAYLWEVHGALARRYPGPRHADLVEEAAHTALVDYVKRPATYNPGKGLSLLRYLIMSAEGDFKNALRKEQRHTVRAVPLEDVEHALDDGNKGQGDDGIDLPRGVSERALDELWREITDPIEREVLRMMYVDGVREYEAYARTMRLDHLDPVARRRQIKRMKDRLEKRVRRLGERLRDSGPA